ncbi:hypothetical protein FVEN_g4682 [Fusarium venenatum]|uniref:Uncharacterized protein n=1 Tax=Fusarium venenatum TaxID=56646 RepID=A0A2L2TB89_9HYPO|nr:uncharacterized protein FVRRES_11473 [Fusarium venenatum]KAG8357329.1 hypothetical protein FVEN_g4682 [Fusarium venenatum]KAH6978161.1 hypothetical protein EDB82DRAFT_526260 [Fusarium venenatum]CEI38782.1 unnamed protein product [Fusarium venenatum]
MFRQAADGTSKLMGRRKMFIKKTDPRSGEIYYVLNKWSHAPKSPPENDYFEANGLLLDLDDMFSKHVRPATEKDDIQALKLWSRNPKEKAIRKNLYKLEKTLDESRLRVFEARSRPLNSWRLGSYDVFSAALRAPSRSPLIGYSQGAISTSTAETQPSKLHLLCSNNGIEAEALHNGGSLLLERFQSRLSLFKSETGPEVSASQLSEVLGSQDSLTSLRRLVSQYLSCNPNGIAFYQAHNAQQDSQLDLSLDVRTACESFWQPNVPQSTCDLLTFIGNLGQRLSAREEHLGGPLCGFGMKLSAEICVPTISHQYLNMGSEINHWSSSDQGIGDIVQVLGTYMRHFTTDPESNKLDVKDREALLKLLVGDVDQEDPPTVRSLILDLLQDKSREDMAQKALDAYRAYIVLLGHLGAAALLEHEIHFFAAGEIGGSRDGDRLEDSGHQPDATVAEAFQVAIDNLAVPPDKAVLPANLDFAGCVMLDLRAIGN